MGEKWAHPVPHGDRPRADELEVDAALVHDLEVALQRGLEPLVGDLQLTGRVEVDVARDVGAEVGRGGHVAVYVDDFGALEHGDSPLAVCTGGRSLAEMPEGEHI
jgi:hypothetical protein